MLKKAFNTMQTTLSPGQSLDAIRQHGPLVHNITNLVAMDLAANALLAIGASPVMAHAQEEVEDFVSLAGALAINIGTFTPEWQDAAVSAAVQALGNETPWILDPVGCGATRFRMENAMRLLKIRPSLVRGNASEIAALANNALGTGKGVETTMSVAEVEVEASRLAREAGLVVAVTGEEDFVTDGQRALRITGGHPLMTRVTAVGCALTAITGAFMAVEEDVLAAAGHALACMAVAGETAGKAADAPGSFRVELLDALYRMRPEELNERAAIQWLETEA